MLTIVRRRSCSSSRRSSSPSRLSSLTIRLTVAGATWWPTRSATGAALWVWSGSSALHTGMLVVLGLVMLCVVAVLRSGLEQEVAV